MVRPLGPSPCPADADRPALERELEELVVRYMALREAWPKAWCVLDRAAIGREVERAERRIREIEQWITEAEA